MKHLIPLLLALLLCGCGAAQPSAPPAVTQPPALLTAPDHSESLTTYGSEELLQGLSCLNGQLLLFTGAEATTLSLVDPAAMTVTAEHDTHFCLLPETDSFQLLSEGLSYFDGTHTVVLGSRLQELRRIPAPENLCGIPLLSSGGSILYYCTDTAVRALDLSTGISRMLKEASYPVQELSAVLLQDSVLQLSITDTDSTSWTLFLCADTGQLLRECPAGAALKTHGQDYFYHRSAEDIPAILFGTGSGTPQVLMPRGDGLNCTWLPGSRQVLSVFQDADSTALDLYDLTTGQRTASLENAGCPGGAVEADGCIFFLSHEDNTLRRWDPGASPVADPRSYVSTYHTRQDPDYEGLALCALKAEELSQKHSINILVYKDAVEVQPWDYDLEYEHRPDILQQELQALDERLSRFPAGFLETLTQKFTGLNICLVRSAAGSPESGSVASADGIQFLVDFEAYVALSTSQDPEYALYHELSHLMETVVLTCSTAYDRWDGLNPENFEYDCDYIANQSRDGSPWLKPGSEYFIDTYAMSYPREDRARLFEYAMTSGHESLFSSPNLQRKLRQMCLGLREAFDLEDFSSPLPWEQYLGS